MALSKDFAGALRAKLGKQAEGTILALERLLGEDAIRDYYLWVGPAYGDEALRLDVYALTDDCLYNYYQRDDDEIPSCIFLDMLESLSMTRVEDARTPNIVSVRENGGEVSRIFGGEGDRDRLLDFCRSTIEAADNS